MIKFNWAGSTTSMNGVGEFTISDVVYAIPFESFKDADKAYKMLTHAKRIGEAEITKKFKTDMMRYFQL